MTGLPITFTCTCTGTQDGCGTLSLTDDVNTVMDWSSDAWNANTNSITGTGTITFIEEDKGQRTFTCGSNSQSKSSAQSTLDVVG